MGIFQKKQEQQIPSYGGETMPEELITPENLSKEILKSVFDAAYMDTSYDDEGDLRVKDGVRCFLLLGETKDRIQLLTMFGFKPETSRQERLEFANELNKRYLVIKAIVGTNDALRFEYDILIGQGITKKALVLTVKRFCGIPQGAIQNLSTELGADIVK